MTAEWEPTLASKTKAADHVDHESSAYKATRGGNARDLRDMARMGKTQELQRNFKLVTMFGFSAILMCSWESLLSSLQIALANGGTAGLIWTWLTVWMGFTAVYLSMAEMGSMAPTTGGQYHWVSEFSPRKYQRFLSYVVGWLGVLGWQALQASIGFQAGTIIQGLLVLNYPDSYTPERWHGSLLVIAVLIFGACFNIFLATRLHLVEGTILIVHVYGIFCILVPLWILSPRSTAEFAWTTFQDPGWNSAGLSALIGMQACVVPLLGADASVHMSEELKDAAYTLPRSMMWATFINGVMGWVTAITTAYCIGDLAEVMKTPTGFPFIQMFYNSTQSLAATNAMTAIIVFMDAFSAVTIMASASRQMYAFARDQGTPYSAWLSRVSPKLDVPVNAVVASTIISCLLSLINVGSTVAFNSLVSLTNGVLMVSYSVCIGCFVWRRLSNKPMLPSRFDLGKFGLVVNVLALAFLVMIFVMAFFPPTPAPTLQTMNWSSLVFSMVAIWGGIFYFVWARYRYVGPVEYVRKLD
ncbi:Putative amino acid/polyamine transporter I [Septoria linicola]|uniref:Amino acid/polyamine transporter I n=1 Tax=Septoria linicola TaxID=215465 RepID=A0A9Q9AQY8_9PEZI|nr:putative amino acid/polyamine transporter I [Septoria linicola]USW52899.1 Putative amino acid/polyamine transporter I [Septoria linicola]